ncbi:hypothetical protein R6Q59_013011 [Mikania micrantha]
MMLLSRRVISNGLHVGIHISLMNDDQIHWFSIINSLMIVLFLSGMVAMIMMRTLYRDIANYNQLDAQEEAQEETGWKACSWRRLQGSRIFRITLCICRDRCTASGNDTCHYDICISRVLITIQPWWPYDCHGSFMGIHGPVWWLFICTIIQNV